MDAEEPEARRQRDRWIENGRFRTNRKGTENRFGNELERGGFDQGVEKGIGFDCRFEKGFGFD